MSDPYMEKFQQTAGEAIEEREGILEDITEPTDEYLKELEAQEDSL